MNHPRSKRAVTSPLCAEAPRQGKASIRPAAILPSDSAPIFGGNLKAPPRAATNRHGGADQERDVTSLMASDSVFTRSHICLAGPSGVC